MKQQWNVRVQQINAEMFTVQANSREAAIAKAKRIWQSENAWPTVLDAQSLQSEREDEGGE